MWEAYNISKDDWVCKTHENLDGKIGHHSHRHSSSEASSNQEDDDMRELGCKPPLKENKTTLKLVSSI